MTSTLTRMARSLAMSVGLGRVNADTDESRGTACVQVALPGGEIRSEVPLLQQAGFCSRAVQGSDIAVIFLAGDRSRGVAVATGDQRERPRDLDPGDVCLYHVTTGSRVWLKSDGSIVLAPSSGQVSLNGTLTVSEDVIANGISLTGHEHSGVQQGEGNSGPPVKS